MQFIIEVDAKILHFIINAKIRCISCEQRKLQNRITLTAITWFQFLIFIIAKGYDLEKESFKNKLYERFENKTYAISTHV